jgi:hypothetical protein
MPEKHHVTKKYGGHSLKNKFMMFLIMHFPHPSDPEILLSPLPVFLTKEYCDGVTQQ